MPTQLTQPKDTKRQAEAPATVSHAFVPPSGNDLGSAQGLLVRVLFRGWKRDIGIVASLSALRVRLRHYFYIKEAAVMG